MAEAVDMVHRRALEPHRHVHLMAGKSTQAQSIQAAPIQAETRDWLIALGFTVKDEALWQQALTHGSTGEKRHYQRLEFLGDRVLGLSIADWLYRQGTGSEGELAQR